MCIALVRRSMNFAQLKFGLKLTHVAVVVLSVLPGLASSQTSPGVGSYPERPVRIVVGFPAGGAADVLARLLSERLSVVYKQPFIVENRGGAGGTIGAAAVARAEGDGYTLLMGVTASQTIAPSVYKDLPYDPLKNFAPVAMVATIPIALVVNSEIQAKTPHELIALARTSNPPLAYGSSGIGAIPHLTAAQFQSAQNLELLHVPFKGSAPAMTELLAGRVQLMFDHLPSSLPHIQAGKLKALAIAGEKRSQSLPDVPTLKEAGIEGMEIRSWFGLVAPAGIPALIAQNLNETINIQLNDPKVQKAIAAIGAEPESMDIGKFGELIESDIRKWTEIVRRNDVSL